MRHFGRSSHSFIKHNSVTSSLSTPFAALYSDTQERQREAATVHIQRVARGRAARKTAESIRISGTVPLLPLSPTDEQPQQGQQNGDGDIACSSTAERGETETIQNDSNGANGLLLSSTEEGGARTCLSAEQKKKEVEDEEAEGDEVEKASTHTPLPPDPSKDTGDCKAAAGGRKGGSGAKAEEEKAVPVTSKTEKAARAKAARKIQVQTFNT